MREEDFSFLNEKDPIEPLAEDRVELPAFIEGQVVSDEVKRLRDHKDLRIARRALTLAKLAQKISERNVDIGLRRALVSQSMRLLTLANQRFEELKKKPVIKKTKRTRGGVTIEEMLDGFFDPNGKDCE